MERCDDCGYVYAVLDRAALAATIRRLADQLDAVLTSTPVDALRVHTDPDSWSALEYACHVRDVLAVQRTRIVLALHQDTPAFASMRREERVREERYNEQDPTRVVVELNAAADALATTLEQLDEAGWSRTGVYNWPTTAVRTVEWIARHTIHEQQHHADDIGRLLAT